jgi:hypothetical protein
VRTTRSSRSRSTTRRGSLHCTCEKPKCIHSRIVAGRIDGQGVYQFSWRQGKPVLSPEEGATMTRVQMREYIVKWQKIFNTSDFDE